MISLLREIWERRFLGGRIRGMYVNKEIMSMGRWDVNDRKYILGWRVVGRKGKVVGEFFV